MHRAAPGRLRDLLPHPGAGAERGGGDEAAWGAVAPGAGCGRRLACRRARAAARLGGLGRVRVGGPRRELCSPPAPFSAGAPRTCGAAAPPLPGAAPRRCTAQPASWPAAAGAVGFAGLRHPGTASPRAGGALWAAVARVGRGNPGGDFLVPRGGNGAARTAPRAAEPMCGRTRSPIPGKKALPWRQGPWRAGTAVTEIAGRVQNEALPPLPLHLRQKITWSWLFSDSSCCVVGKKNLASLYSLYRIT